MTDNIVTELLSSSSDSRRSFLKKGAVATGALAVTSGTGAAQTDDDGVDAGGDLDDNWKALTFIDNFHPNARFTFVSGVVKWAPNYGDVRDSWFSDYNTYQIRWLNTDNVVPLFVAEDANVGEYDQDLGYVPDADDEPEQPQLFEMNREWSPFGDNNRLITVNAGPVEEDLEDDILDTDDWWQDSDPGVDTTPTDGTNTTATDGTNSTVTDGGN